MRIVIDIEDKRIKQWGALVVQPTEPVEGQEYEPPMVTAPGFKYESEPNNPCFKIVVVERQGKKNDVEMNKLPVEEQGGEEVIPEDDGNIPLPEDEGIPLEDTTEEVKPGTEESAEAEDVDETTEEASEESPTDSSEEESA